MRPRNFGNSRKYPFLMPLLLSVILLLAGCASSSGPLVVSKNTSEPGSPASSTVVLAPGDNIDVKFFYTPELNESQKVRPDGTLSLQLIGSVKADGKSPADLENDLTKAYAAVLKEPKISVIARSLRNQKVYVGGEVIKPGEIDMPGPLSVLEAISYAGGFKTETAEPRNVIVIRHKNGHYSGTPVNLKDALAGKQGEAFILESNDIVFVPQTRIAKVNLWIDQHINKILPKIPVSFSP